MSRPRSRWVSLSTIVAIGAAVAALAVTAGREAAARHVMSPTSGPATLYRSIGQPAAGAHGSVLFTCQLTTPPGCYGPDQIRAAYAVQPLLDRGLDGRGRTIVIIDAYGSPTIESDLALFDSIWGLPAPPSFRIETPFGVAPTDPDNAAGWAGETSLDVEWAHAIAPGASILLVVARSNDDADILDATQWVLEHNAGDVLSQSYGEAEQCMDPSLLARQHELFRRLTQRDITLLASSGDAGAGQPTCDGSGYFKAVSTPASDPFVTGVGGTILDADGTTGDYKSETTWNESETFGDAVAGGGGVSVVYSRPSYQAPVSKETMRTVPDVSYNAAVFGGVIVAWGGRFWRFGGTSAGSPQWAGLVAIADQIGRGRVGAINKPAYKVGKGVQSRFFFHDIADGSSNSIPDLDIPGTPIDGFTAVPGYDLATGLGTPIATTLVPWLAVHAERGDDDFGSKAGSYRWGGHRGHKRDH